MCDGELLICGKRMVGDMNCTVKNEITATLLHSGAHVHFLAEYFYTLCDANDFDFWSKS